MNAEFDRFLTLFDRLVHLSDVCARGVPDDKADWIPVVNETVRYENRITDVTIRNLYVHMIVSEHHWFRQLRHCPDGAEIDIPSDPALTQRISEAGFRREAMRLHEANMAELRAYPAAVLDRAVSYTGRRFSAMGFLWAVYAHRAYHLGNIDIYMRQGQMSPPNFFDFEPMTMA